MTTITLDIPDELAARLVTRREQIPQVLSLALDLLPQQKLLAGPISAELSPAFKEMVDFLVSSPTPAQIVAFKISPLVQARLEELLDKNREDSLTDEEGAELDVYEQVNHVLLILKARVRAELATAT